MITPAGSYIVHRSAVCAEWTQHIFSWLSPLFLLHLLKLSLFNHRCLQTSSSCQQFSAPRQSPRSVHSSSVHSLIYNPSSYPHSLSHEQLQNFSANGLLDPLQPSLSWPLLTLFLLLKIPSLKYIYLLRSNLFQGATQTSMEIGICVPCIFHNLK